MDSKSLYNNVVICEVTISNYHPQTWPLIGVGTKKSCWVSTLLFNYSNIIMNSYDNLQSMEEHQHNFVLKKLYIIQCTVNEKEWYSTFYKQNIKLNICCILVRIFVGWFAMGRHEGGGRGSGFFSFFLLLSWKNCCITSAQSDASTPRRIVIFGWNGWTGAAGFSDGSDPSPPLGKSLQIVSNFRVHEPQEITCLNPTLQMFTHKLYPQLTRNCITHNQRYSCYFLALWYHQVACSTPASNQKKVKSILYQYRFLYIWPD